MEIGQLIKLERQRQNMKQEYLASGICVPSYLSRIENGLVKPSEDIQHHILMRLNIPLDSLKSEINQEKTIHFKTQFKTVINSRNKQKAETLQLDIHNYIECHPFEPNRLTLLLIETRLMLMLPDKTINIRNNLAILVEFKKEMDPEQLFYLYTIQGIVAYQNNQFSQASELFAQIFTLIKNYRMEDWEMAELYYVSSLSLLSESRYIMAIDYVKSALSYFNQELLIERSIECLIILGIAQIDTGVLKEAIATFEKAKEISLKIDSSKYNGKIEHNLGASYSILGNQNQALYHFQNSLDIKTRPDDKIVTILSLLKEYHKINDVQNAIVWLERGFEIISYLSGESKNFFKSHFNIYRALLLEENNIISIFKEALAYFEEIQDYKYCFIYCQVLAKRLADKKQYKQSTIYYQLGFNYNLKLSHVTNWEELS
ncbi:helix-turn-helix transcriptional regulator [Psychrobacillus sp. FJAT-51614]|uniref:Helix-turn-helix transcriptional regulator n=1 Tax=Psychrobacillus mangrovi TaxID=3117745 RepID=A0ABU8F6X3_9BACI